MDGVVRPVGGLPPDVYWRRRIVSIAFVILVLLVLYYLIRGLFVSSPELTPSAGPSASPGPSVSATATPDPSGTTAANPAGRNCGPEDLTFVLSPSQRYYGAEELPAFTATITNGALTACDLNTGAADLELVVTSGSDRVWDSRDCLTTPLLPSQVLTFPAGGAGELQMTWPRVRSNEVCSTALGEPSSGEYRATFTLQGITSDQAFFGLD